jgi:hypothetical protein
MTEGGKGMLEQYLHHSRVLDNEGLREFWRDGDYSLVCSNRQGISEMDLDEEAVAKVEAADERLREAFDPETLEKYAYDFPTMPIREWWG